MNRIFFCIGAAAFVTTFCTLASAQESTSSPPAGGPEPLRIMPVRVVPDAELGTELERFASSTNRLLEKRERDLSNLTWKIDDRTTLTPTAILVRDVNAPQMKRVGVKFDYVAKASGRGKDERVSRLLDFEELGQIEEVLNSLIRAASQADPPKGETVVLHFASRTGFEISLSMVRKGEDAVLTAAIEGTEVNSKEKAIKLFEDCRNMVHALAAQLSSL